MQQGTVVETNLAALRQNYRTLAQWAQPAQVLGIVKANAYGHGAVVVAKCLAAEGVKLFGVATVDEALELRAAGLAQDLLIMGVVDPWRMADVADANLIVSVHAESHLEECLKAFRAAQRVKPTRTGKLRCHLKVDTGMGRLGVPYEHAAELAALLKAQADVAFEGLMTHMSHGDSSDLGQTHRQLANFRAVLAALTAAQIRPPLVHAANSGTLLLCPEAKFDAVRPGLALYGISPCPPRTRHVSLRPVMTVRSVIAALKDIPVGQGVGYGHTWRAKAPSRVAALPLGYADGYRRAFSNRTVVRVAGQLCPTVGTVSMDTTLVDVTAVPWVKVGARVTVLEADNDSPLSAYALARIADTIPYEIFTGFSSRVRRQFTEA